MTSLLGTKEKLGGKSPKLNVFLDQAVMAGADPGRLFPGSDGKSKGKIFKNEAAFQADRKKRAGKKRQAFVPTRGFVTPQLGTQGLTGL